MGPLSPHSSICDPCKYDSAKFTGWLMAAILNLCFQVFKYNFKHLARTRIIIFHKNNWYLTHFMHYLSKLLSVWPWKYDSARFMSCFMAAILNLCLQVFKYHLKHVERVTSVIFDKIKLNLSHGFILTSSYMHFFVRWRPFWKSASKTTFRPFFAPAHRKIWFYWSQSICMQVYRKIWWFLIPRLKNHFFEKFP